MADNRKTFESTPPQPPSGNIPDPAAATSTASRGADVGGIPKTADSALGDSIDSSHDTPDVAPRKAGSSGGKGAEGSKTADKLPAGKAATSPKDKAGEESPLESLGRAIGAPLSGETSKDEPPQ